MKKLLFTFSLLVAMSSFAIAQGVVNISGQVTDANGNAMGGYPVEVMSDSLSGINFYTTAFTNNSGYYSVNATVGMLSQGGFYVWTQDSCSFNFLSQTVYFSPGNMSISNVDFSICPNGSGGGGSCAAGFTYQTNANGLVTFSGTATGGQAPYTYSWALGNGMTANTQNTSATYTSGLYLACLTITDATGCMNTYCDTVGVNTGGGTACSAYFTSQVNPTGSITLAGIATGGQAPYTYSWSLGNGTSANGQVVNAVYNSPGVYAPCLTITDAAGCTSTYCDSVYYGGGGGSNCSVTFTNQTTALGATSFTSNVSGTTGAVAYLWDFGDGSMDSSSNPVHTYATNGLYMACLTIFDANGCVSTYCDTISIQNASSGCNAIMSYSSNNTLTVNFSATATGTAPFTYAWDFGDSLGTATTANPSYTYGASGVYVACVTITDATGCTVTDCDLITVNVSTSGSLNVLVVSDSLVGFPQAVVYLIEHDTAAGTLTAIQTDTTMQGFATFNNLPFGNYLLKAALLPSDPNYSNYLPTYYTQSLNWSGGTQVQLTPGIVGFTFIELIAGNNVGTGPGFIGGLITQGANGPGDPIEGALVILYDANMNPIGYTYTDEDGEYSFDNLPYGVYYIYVEELGLISSPVEVTLSPTTPSMDQVHFEVGSTYVMFTSTNEILSVSELKVYPNPVTDALYMQFELDQTLDAEISIVNITGQTLANFQKTLNGGNNLIQVPTSELPAGIYTIFLKSEAGIITQKFIKQ